MSHITSFTIVYSTVYRDADQIKYQSTASLGFVRGPVNSPHKWPVTRKTFPWRHHGRSYPTRWPQQMDYLHLSSTLPEIDPDTAYVVCISVSLGFRQKPSDTALLSVIALTTFNCIVSASVTKGVLVCFVVTVHWWRHRTHYDVTEAYRVLRNILTVDLNNGATRADLRGIPKHYEATAKAGR